MSGGYTLKRIADFVLAAFFIMNIHSARSLVSQADPAFGDNHFCLQVYLFLKSL